MQQNGIGILSLLTEVYQETSLKFIERFTVDKIASVLLVSSSMDMLLKTNFKIQALLPAVRPSF